LTGSRELAAADGAQVLAPRASRLGFAHRGLEDGQEVDLGGLTLRVLATPGHAPEHVSYLLLDAGRPLALFSGGALLVGTVARTDLAGAELTEPLARAAYRSLHGRLLSLPDELAVYPTHGAGSFCATPAGDQRTTTIGAERRHNRLLAAPDEDAFVAHLLASFGSYPPYFLRLRERNRVGPELLGRDWKVLPLLSTDQVHQHLADGGVLVDARPVAAFAAGQAAVVAHVAAHELGAAAVIVTGGHGDEPVDHFYDGVEHYEFPVARHDVPATHGAGCTHSATLAALLVLAVARVAHEAVGLGERGRADEVGVDLQG
jgi:hypothetical protein